VTVLDHNAASIDIARQFFGMPQDIPCIVEDFRTFLASCNRQFGGIAVDVGGPGFCFEQQFDEKTCRHIARVLAPGGRMIMNMLVGSDFDGATDTIASLLSGEGRTCWIFDQPGLTNRNALIAGLPQSPKEVNRRRVAMLCSADASWMLRRPRLRRGRNPVKIEINCPAYAPK
jgi:spermidine synthase